MSAHIVHNSKVSGLFLHYYPLEVQNTYGLREQLSGLVNFMKRVSMAAAQAPTVIV